MRPKVDRRSIQKGIREMKKVTRNINLATRKAINESVKVGNKELLRQISKESRVPQKALRKARMRTYKATVSDLTGRVWAGTFRMKASKIGAPKQTARGAKAGKHRFSDAFVATVGKITGIFKREPLPSTRKSRGAWSKNLPIQQQHVDIKAEDLSAVESKTLAKLEQTLAQELEKRI